MWYLYLRMRKASNAMLVVIVYINSVMSWAEPHVPWCYDIGCLNAFISLLLTSAHKLCDVESNYRPKSFAHTKRFHLVPIPYTFCWYVNSGPLNIFYIVVIFPLVLGLAPIPCNFFCPHVNSGLPNILHINVIFPLVVGLAPIPYNFQPIR